MNIELLITLFLLEAKASVKNPAAKVKLKKSFLKVFNFVKTAYADDPDFS